MELGISFEKCSKLKGKVIIQSEKYSMRSSESESAAAYFTCVPPLHEIGYHGKMAGFVFLPQLAKTCQDLGQLEQGERWRHSRKTLLKVT